VKLLDVAGGTGDIAFRLARSIRSSLVVSPSPAEIVVTDINESMLKVGQERAEKMGFGSGGKCSWRCCLRLSEVACCTGSPVMSWVVGDAQKLPVRAESCRVPRLPHRVCDLPSDGE
jgi:ubiquinone/menaquinone biosynthesis C-methylase UbiE